MNTMCVMWMPANLLTQGIVDKKDKIHLKHENADAHNEEKEQNTESKTDDAQNDK